MPPRRKISVAQKLLEINAQRGSLGKEPIQRYTLSIALRDIQLTQKFIVKSLAAEEKIQDSTYHVLRLLSRHLPIMMVAAMECFFRDTVAELIDKGEPFSGRAAKLMDSSHLNLDYPVFLAVQNKKFTIGQFISHLVPLNSLETISAGLSTLLNGDFLQLLKDQELNSKFWESRGLSVRRIGDDPGPIFSSVERIVEIRNSIAHESRPVRGSAIEEIVQCCDRTKLFLIGAETYFFRLLHPGEPESPNNVELKEYASGRLRDAQKTLDKLLDDYKSYLSRTSEQYTYKAIHDRVAEIENFQNKWKEFVDLKATVAANRYAGGTIWGLIYTRDLEASTLARIEEVRELLKRTKRGDLS